MDCRLWFLNPRLRSDIASAWYLGDDYFSGGDAGYGDYKSQERSLRIGFRALLRSLQRLEITGGRLLEVGSGFGYFLDEARDCFDERLGVELSPKAARSAASLADVPVLESLDKLPANDRFDFIFASHVIEHIYEPVSFTRELLARLRPGGTLMYSTPDMNSFWRKIMGPRWPSFKYPEHVSFFDAGTLSRLFREAGAGTTRKIAIVDRFPLNEILPKLGLAAIPALETFVVPVPATSVCVFARAGGAKLA